MSYLYTPDTSCCDGVLDAIGNTPLIRLRRYLDRYDIRLFAKLEAANPGGSAKDRPARQMIEHGLRTGLIGPQTTIVESSSGNMGIGLAQSCRYHHLRFVCVVDPRAQAQNIAIMQALGAEIEMVTEPLDGDFLAARLQRVRTLIDNNDDHYWPNQYASGQNPLAHQLGTVREVDRALGGMIDYLFVATSSTGTARGCRDYLQSRGRTTRVITVDSVGSVLFDGAAGNRKIPGLGAGQMPDLAQGQQFDGLQRISDLDCVVGCRRMADREAMLVGGSAGGVLHAVASWQQELAGKTVVAILHDSGTRYLDTVYDDDWVQRELGLSPTELHRRVHSEVATPLAAVEPIAAVESTVATEPTGSIA